MNDKRGIRNNNPLNIRFDIDDNWRGLIGPDMDGYCQFDTPEHGIRAAAVNLQTYQEKRDIHTLHGVITRWAPEDDDNPTERYITAVSIRADIEPEEALDLFDYQTVYRLLRAMARFENGKPPSDRDPGWYPPETWEKGLRMAGLVPGKAMSKSRTTHGAVVAGGGIAAMIGILTDTFGLPPDIAQLLPTFLSHLDKTQASVVMGVIALAGPLYTLYARRDDKQKGRL